MEAGNLSGLFWNQFPSPNGFVARPVMMASPLPTSQWLQLNVAATVGSEVEPQLLAILAPVGNHPVLCVDLDFMVRFERNEASASAFLRPKISGE